MTYPVQCDLNLTDPGKVAVPRVPTNERGPRLKESPTVSVLRRCLEPIESSHEDCRCNGAACLE